MRVSRLWIALVAVVEFFTVSCSRSPAEEAAPVPLAVFNLHKMRRFTQALQRLGRG